MSSKLIMNQLINFTNIFLNWRTVLSKVTF